MIAIIDYGVGNLFSLSHSLTSIGAEVVVTGDAATILRADHVILPGVGAFGDAAAKLRETGLDEVVKQVAANGVPVMGICLGMQLLLDKSYEFGEHQGLGLIPGEVRPISEVIPSDYKIPHIGWNRLDVRWPHPIFRDVKPDDCVYFVHSYYGANCPAVIATAEYGADLTAAVGRGNVVGCQFHPEKSGDVGLGILRAFMEWDGVMLPEGAMIPRVLHRQGRSTPEIITYPNLVRLDRRWHDGYLQLLSDFITECPAEHCELHRALRRIREGSLKDYGAAADVYCFHIDARGAFIEDRQPGGNGHQERYSLEDVEEMLRLHVEACRELYGVDLLEVDDDYQPLVEGVIETPDDVKALRRFPEEDA